MSPTVPTDYNHLPPGYVPATLGDEIPPDVATSVFYFPRFNNATQVATWFDNTDVPGDTTEWVLSNTGLFTTVERDNDDTEVLRKLSAITESPAELDTLRDATELRTPDQAANLVYAHAAMRAAVELSEVNADEARSILVRPSGLTANGASLTVAQAAAAFKTSAVDRSCPMFTRGIQTEILNSARAAHTVAYAGYRGTQDVHDTVKECRKLTDEMYTDNVDRHVGTHGMLLAGSESNQFVRKMLLEASDEVEGSKAAVASLDATIRDVQARVKRLHEGNLGAFHWLGHGVLGIAEQVRNFEGNVTGRNGAINVNTKRLDRLQDEFHKK